ncbi:methyltransferase domain-containing protein [bacterium]|nr:methyltransferase domain-containing protein [bacterium]
MDTSLQLGELEQLTALVYGDTFELYDNQAFNEFLSPLYQRLSGNNISLDIFQGKRCLDAGCGGGRGSVLMAEAGAAEVVGVDISPTNIKSSSRRAEQRGLNQCRFEKYSLSALPFPNESFDIVWCNGVLHHTRDPDKCLQEITRVLKVDGYLWLYLYGSGGIYWYVVDWIRDTLKGIQVRDCIYQLRLMNTPVRRIAEWIDDWFTGYLRRYTIADVTQRLGELGYEQTQALQRGTIYDTSQRRIKASEAELALMGEGDIRHFCRKASSPLGNCFSLPDPDNGKGSPYIDSREVTQFSESLNRLSDDLDMLRDRLGHDIKAYKILVCSSVHSKVRSLLETDEPFDVQIFRQHLVTLNELLAQFAFLPES